MTPAERAAWCIAIADETEAQRGPRPTEGPVHISYFAADVFRRMAAQLLDIQEQAA